MRIERLSAVVALSALASACVTTPSSQMAFDHPQASQPAFLEDRSECFERTIGFLTPTNADTRHTRLFQECMAERGYTRNDATGQFATAEPPVASGAS